MILQITKDEYPADVFAIGVDDFLSLEATAQRGQVKQGTYGYELVADIHWALTTGSLNLKRDYDLYFAKEYCSFAEYLRRRYRYSRRTIAVLSSLYSQYAIVLRFDPGITILGGAQAYVLLESLFSN
jgi:hypothetical protein